MGTVGEVRAGSRYWLAPCYNNNFHGYLRKVWKLFDNYYYFRSKSKKTMGLKVYR